MAARRADEGIGPYMVHRKTEGTEEPPGNG